MDKLTAIAVLMGVLVVCTTGIFVFDMMIPHMQEQLKTIIDNSNITDYQQKSSIAFMVESFEKVTFTLKIVIILVIAIILFILGSQYIGGDHSSTLYPSPEPSQPLHPPQPLNQEPEPQPVEPVDYALIDLDDLLDSHDKES